MANNLSSKLLTLAFPALAVILLLCLSKCLSACTRHFDCSSPSGPQMYCNHDGKCIECNTTEKFDEGSGKCKPKDNNVVNVVTSKKTTIFTPEYIIASLVWNIFLLLGIVGGIVGCCFCCSCCPVYKSRQRKREQAEQAAQASQMMVIPYPAYSNQQMQSQYPNQYAAPPPGYTQYPNSNVTVQGGNSLAQYPVQQQNVQPNVNQKATS